MALFLNNRYRETINVSLLLYDPGCSGSGQPWRKEAWWVIQPGQTILPDAMNVDLTTVNGWVGMYAFSETGDADWQGAGNAWFMVSDGVWFNQCGEDESKCAKWVDYKGMYLGHPDMIAYVGSTAGELQGPVAPYIYVSQGYGEFYVSGSGFVPYGTVTLIWDFKTNTDFTQGTETLNVALDGTIYQTISSSVLIYEGTLDAQATDDTFPSLQARASG